ncbi:MAG TPA: PEP-CTERM sorting domain-containing protein [Cyanobacteria bacterium UBA11369]|nr:PEP-CTERM sorting domain-containing protein [Cyanobacteria bacterium UBA11371]HBE36822.1 PEP-CTERM sorting domain-containing protein [Cyanobacteria bacterium UBA11368]HBE49619.1 PEP-CTERM sorting domain-containing protein [Cyanobacteria bacterium UBA11369]
MKAKQVLGLMAAASTALVSYAVPGKAASLTPGESFGNQGIKFLENTDVRFTFVQSNGMFQSTVKLFEVGADNALTFVKDLFVETKGSDRSWHNGWLGTCGNTVAFTEGTSCTSYFTFLANKTYTLGLDSGVNGIVYSTTALNNFAPGGTQQAVFNSFGSQAQADTTRFTGANGAAFQSGDPLAMIVRIGFDDRGNGNDKDFQDVTITAFGSRTAVPEPTALAGLALSGGALAFSRRRRVGRV